MRILFVNELGGGLGHLVPLVAVASALGPAWDRRFLVPDPVGARSFVAGQVGPDAAVDRSPPWSLPGQGADCGPTHAFADALHAMGLGEAGAWRAALRFWTDLFGTVQPDLVVTDAAPGVRLAAAGRVPVVAIGNGYSAPPSGRLLPNLVDARPDVPPATRRREALVLAAANEVQAERGGPTLDFVADLFNGDATIVRTHPALDPYRSHRTGPTWWPGSRPRPAADVGRGGPRTSLFVYLHSDHPGLASVLDLVGRIGRGEAAPGLQARAGLLPEVYVLGGDPAWIEGRCGPGTVVHREPVRPMDVLGRARLVVHHGGSGTSHEALACGAPQLLLPLNLEQALTSRSLQSLGVGYVVSQASRPGGSEPYDATLWDGMTHLLRPEVQAETTLRADELRASNLGDTLGTVVATCRRLVGAAGA